MIKTSHASGRGLACNRKQKKTKKESKNSTYTNGETDWSNLKSSSREDHLMVSILQSDDQRDRTFIERTLEK